MPSGQSKTSEQCRVRLADAVRFVIEEIAPAYQMRAFIDVGDETLPETESASCTTTRITFAAAEADGLVPPA
jgi:hypothetical protein